MEKQTVMLALISSLMITLNAMPENKGRPRLPSINSATPAKDIESGDGANPSNCNNQKTSKPKPNESRLMRMWNK
jgi:hypothetical protein